MSPRVQEPTHDASPSQLAATPHSSWVGRSAKRTPLRQRPRNAATRSALCKRTRLCWKCSDTRAGLCGRSLQRRRLPRARLPLGRLRQRSQRAPALPISTTQRQPLGLSKRRSLRCVAAAADGGGVTAVLALIVLSEARACRWAAAWILAVGSLARRDSLCPATTFLRRGSCVSNPQSSESCCASDRNRLKSSGGGPLGGPWDGTVSGCEVSGLWCVLPVRMFQMSAISVRRASAYGRSWVGTVPRFR